MWQSTLWTACYIIPSIEVSITSQVKSAEDAGEASDICSAETEVGQDAIREQMARILASRHFRNSKRSPSLLRYSIERSLQGNHEHLKERTVGIEVFGRNPDYDTNADPVVRMAAVEVRKRLALYYDDPEHEAEIRIDFPPGSYVTEFRAPPSADLLPVETPESSLVTPTATVERRTRPGMLALVLLAGAITTGVAIAIAVFPHQTALDHFWRPVLEAPGSILLSVPVPSPMNTITKPDGPQLNGTRVPTPSAGPAPVDLGNPGPTTRELMQADKVIFSDALTLANLAGFMRARNRPFHIRRAAGTSFQDLRDGPVILIGAFNNGWTLRLTGDLRFSFVREADSAYIRDRMNPLSRKWSHRHGERVAEIKEDYAIATRVLDPLTGRFVVTAAGLLNFGTAAVGEFLTEPSWMEDALRSVGSGWDRKNIQIVISTKVVGLNSGPPRVLDVYAW